MHLAHVHQLLLATEKQLRGSLKVTTPQAKSDVRDMVQAGLVEATMEDGSNGDITAIESVTEAGRAFLRAFKGDDFSDENGLVPVRIDE